MAAHFAAYVRVDGLEAEDVDGKAWQIYPELDSTLPCAHTWCEVTTASGVFAVDWTASQFGRSEFPAVVGSSHRRHRPQHQRAVPTPPPRHINACPIARTNLTAKDTVDPSAVAFWWNCDREWSADRRFPGSTNALPAAAGNAQLLWRLLLAMLTQRLARRNRALSARSPSVRQRRRREESNQTRKDGRENGD